MCVFAATASAPSKRSQLSLLKLKEVLCRRYYWPAVSLSRPAQCFAEIIEHLRVTQCNRQTQTINRRLVFEYNVIFSNSATCPQSISAFVALEVFFSRNALYKSTSCISYTMRKLVLCIRDLKPPVYLIDAIPTKRRVTVV